MKRLLNMLLIIGLLIGLGASFQGCMLFSGHGDDASPYEEGEGTLQTWEEVFGSEDEIPAGIKSKLASHDTAANSVLLIGEMLNTLGYQVSSTMLGNTTTSKSVNTSKYVLRSTFSRTGIFIHHTDGEGGSVVVRGDSVTVDEKYGHCVVFANLEFDYTSYKHPGGMLISGSEKVKVLATSYACDYHLNMHVDYKMQGDLTVDNVRIEELEFTADFNSTSGVRIWINSAIVDTDEGYRYCYEGPYDATECVSGDGRQLADFCSSDDDVCAVTVAGHEACAEASSAGSEGHCNMGCCTSLPAESNTCNDEWTNRRECDPSIDSFFTASYAYRDFPPADYNPKLICTPDGLWSPPCDPNNADSLCPFGGTCIASDSVDWGLGLEGYGYCSCTGEELN